MQYASSSNRSGAAVSTRSGAASGRTPPPVGWSEQDSHAPSAQGRAALMQAKLGPRVDLNGKIREAIFRQAVFLTLLAGLGIYAHDFVYEGIMAKAALNLTIVGVFILAAGISINNVLQMRNEKVALDALRADFGDRRPGADVVDSPAIVFKKPKLLGYGYRLVTEELLARNKGQLPTETIHILVGDVDHRIKDAQATMGYFGGLLVFLGLLGAFMGLMKTVSSVGELIGTLGGEGGGGGFDAMIDGMKKPLHGMSVGFSSSLFGLLFSMVVGVVDRFMTAAMKAVRNEFEACLIDLAHLEMAEHEDDSHGSHAQHGPAHAPTYAPHATAMSQDAGALLEQLERNERQSLETNRLLADMNATMFALAASFRQSAEAESRTQLGDVLTGLARSQRDLAAQLSSMNTEASEQNTRIAQAIESASRSAEETRTVMSDLAFRITNAPEIPLGAMGLGAAQQGGPYPAQNQVAVQSAASAEPSVPAMVGRSRANAHAAAAHPPVAQFPQMPQMPQAPMQDADPNDTGARALMARLALAMGQRRTGPAPTKGVSEEKGKQLERAMIATQQLSRQVLKRMDETRRDETRSAVAISKAQRQVIASMDLLVKRMDELMDSGEIVAKGKVEKLNSTLDQTKALLDVKIDRLEQHLAASHRIAERTERAVTETARTVKAQAPAARAKAVGE